MFNLESQMGRRDFLLKSIRRGAAIGGGLLLAAAAPAIILPTQAQAIAISSRVDIKSLEFRQAVAGVISEVETAGVSLPSFLPTEAREEGGWIEVGPEPGELNQEQWFPYDAAVARDRGLVRMHALGGPLYIHDQITGRHAQEWEEDIANSALIREPFNRGWLGHCDDVAGVMAFHEPLPAGVLGEGVFVFEGLEINKTIVMGLQAEKHAPDAKIAFRNTEAGILALLTVAINRRWALVASIPGLGNEGQVWSYIITKIRADLGLVEAQNFGRIIYIPPSAIASAYFPLNYDLSDPESYQDIDPEVRAKTARYFNKELDNSFIAQISQR